MKFGEKKPCIQQLKEIGNNVIVRHNVSMNIRLFLPSINEHKCCSVLSQSCTVGHFNLFLRPGDRIIFYKRYVFCLVRKNFYVTESPLKNIK